MTFCEEISRKMQANITLQSKSVTAGRINLLTPNSPRPSMTAK